MADVSVCIPTYNYARFLPRAIESVLAQTHDGVELIVIDDVSTDDTDAAVAPYLDDPRVTFTRNERNIGLFANFNRCLESGDGEYVKVLCADDWLHPDSIADARALFDRHPSIAMTTSPGWLVDEDGEVTGLFSAPFGDRELVDGRTGIQAHADWGNTAGMPSHVLLRRDLAKHAGGFDPAFEPASDMHLWLKLLSHHDLGWVAEPRCYLRVHSSKSHTYGADPTEGVFRSWEDMAEREPAAVDSTLLDRALYREAREHLLYVGAHLLRLRFSRAQKLLAAIRRHIPLRRVVPRFLRDLPWLVKGQAGRILALRRGRLVVYDPAPRIGPPRET